MFPVGIMGLIMMLIMKIWMIIITLNKKPLCRDREMIITFYVNQDLCWMFFLR